MTVLAFLFWLVLCVVYAFRFRPPTQFSDLERRRLVAAGSRVALEESEQLAQVPLLESLRYLIGTVIGVLMVTTLVFAYGVVNGVLLGAVGLMLAPLGQRLPWVCQLADALRAKIAPYLTRAVEVMAPLLKLVRSRDAVGGVATLNSKEELGELIRRSPAVLSREETITLQSVLSFGDKCVRDVMTPRSVIDAIDVGEGIGPLIMDQLHKTGHSRFPVYDGDIDHVVGTLYLHDLIDLKSGHASVREAMHPQVFYINEHEDLEHALHGFLRTRHHLFIVVNEYRETVGLLSLEDVLETLLGRQIVDEFDEFQDLRKVAEKNPRKNNQPKGRTQV